MRKNRISAESVYLRAILDVWVVDENTAAQFAYNRNRAPAYNKNELPRISGVEIEYINRANVHVWEEVGIFLKVTWHRVSDKIP